ncbi:MAG TPA: FAD-dependent oxidoreductase [Magnetovibrio sp.]
MNAPLSQDIVVIGSGIAGITLVREIRKLNTDASITLITADDGDVYSKPMLSNAFAQGKTLSSLVQKSADVLATELNITVRASTKVLRLTRTDKSVTVEGPGGRDTVRYGQLVLATGANARAYRVEGSGGAPLYSVNNLDDFARWREALTPGARVLIIGAGLIGSEFANDLRTGGYGVSVVDPAPWPLGRLLPEALGGAMADALEQAGIALHMGRAVTAMLPSDKGGWVAKLDDGKLVEFDIALSAIGLVANTDLAKDAGLSVEQGIRVDGMLRTSDPDIFALGDCAQTDAGVLPYILPVMAAARALAKTLTGMPTSLHLPALPVSVKTPALACVVCPPPFGATGHWVVQGKGRDLKALYMSDDGKALGFALTGNETPARQAMAKDMPDLLAA